jgi:hypothetical protein
VAALVSQFAGLIKLACHSRRITALILTILPFGVTLGAIVEKPFAPELRSANCSTLSRSPAYAGSPSIKPAAGPAKAPGSSVRALSASSSCSK